MNTLFQNSYVITLMSRDRPGIVAAIGAAVCDGGGDIDAVSQTVLEGYFTLIMIISFEEAVDTADLAARIEALDDHFMVSITPFSPAPRDTAQSDAAERFVMSAFGTNRPGIVLRFSQYLSSKDINIVDLYGDRRGDRFVLIGQVDIPPRLDIAMLQADLAEIGDEMGFTVRLQHENIFVATNQLRLRREVD